jgi:hypothetical protein
MNIPWALSLGIKRPGREADHSPPCSAEVRMRGAIFPLPQYVYMAWCLLKHRGNFMLSHFCFWTFCRFRQQIVLSILFKSLVFNQISIFRHWILSFNKNNKCEADHSSPFSAEVKEWVELYLHSPNTSTWCGAQLLSFTTNKWLDNFIPVITTRTMNDVTARPCEARTCLFLITHIDCLANTFKVLSQLQFTVIATVLRKCTSYYCWESHYYIYGMNYTFPSDVNEVDTQHWRN